MASTSTFAPSIEDKADLPPFELDDRQRETLTVLFRLLDLNSDGFLDVEEFARFGRALTGRRVEPEQAASQLARADADGDGYVSLPEWLAFGRFIARTPDFFAITDGIKAALARLDEAERPAAVRMPAGGGSNSSSNPTRRG